MAKKTNVDENTTKIKASIEEGKSIIGTNSVLKGLRKKEIKEVFIASNCPKSKKEEINSLASISGVSVNELKQENDQLGVLCKKPFSISALGIKND